MKSFLFSLLTACFLFLPVSVFAAPPYPLNVVSNNTTSIVVTVSGLPTDASTYELYNGATAVGPNALVDTNTWIKSATNGSVVWELSGRNIVQNSTYYFKVKKKAAIDMGGASGITNGDTTVTDVSVFTLGTPTTSIISGFSVDPSSERKAVAGGTISTTSYAPGSLKVIFKWSATAAFSGANEPSDRRQLTSGEGGQAAIGVDGVYALRLSDLTPGSKYYFKQVLQTSTGVVLDTRTGTFDTDQGYVGAGTAKEAELLNSKTYHLLAPWPGLSELMDPDLCLQKKADKAIPQDAICDVNGFLNFAFKLLISITAVVLVLRLIFEGYQYIVTDIPFLKANAKSGFFESLLGLLLALSAFLILNTINPKLVNNTISIDSVDVGIEEQLALEQAGYDAVSARKLSPDDIRNIVITYQGRFKYIKDEYVPARDAALPNASKGVKILITAHSAMEGFYPGSKSYRTKNPGNIGNTDNGATVTYQNLGDGIKKQYDHINGIVMGTNPNYKIGKSYASLGEVYDGSLYQYLKIYSTAARQSNTYLSYMISYFKKEGYTITGTTKMSEIAALK